MKPVNSKICKVKDCGKPCAKNQDVCFWHYVHGETATKGGIILKPKDYIDYLKESTYRESYKKFCIKLYTNILLEEGRGFGGRVFNRENNTYSPPPLEDNKNSLF